ncbi:MAG: HlyC/CorC family transporter [Nanoarchaeota archaeon]|nr:HlyC/CorC family transporter [Nanoarchaeota archaeon]
MIDITVNEVLILVVYIALSGIFSASETALISLSRFKIRLFTKKNARGSNSLKKLKDNPHKMLITLLICNNVVNIGASAFAAGLAIRIWPENNPLAYATGIMTFLILVFGEIVPKNLATTHSDKISLFIAPAIYTLSIILYPLIIIFDFITVKIFRVQPVRPKITEEEIKNIVDIAKEEGGIDKEEKEMIQRIFKFDDIDVDEIKVPRTDMIMLNAKYDLKAALDLIDKKHHSRFPVYEENKDKIVGTFYFKDALEYIKKKKFDISIEKLMRKPLFVPDTKKIDEMLKLFQKKKQHMAIIVDEHGSTSGIITVEDILEEIVGEIVDETEKFEPGIRKLDKNIYKVLGKADIEDINKELKTDLKVCEDYDTLSGYILKKIGRIPEEEEEIELKKIVITINRVENNRIIDVIVKKK